MNRILSIFNTLALLGLFFIGSGALAHHPWGPYHWARTQPQFTLKLGDNLTSLSWKAHLFQTSNDWNANPTNFPTVLQTELAAGGAGKRCKAVLGTTQVCNGLYGKNGWLGLATISIVEGKHITQGTAKVNDTYFNTTKYNNPNEKLHVMCQEVAHTFGLSHQSENGESLNTCMDYFSNTGDNANSTVSTKPNDHDFEELSLIYAHTDNATTVAATASSSSTAEDTENSISWGTLISQTRNGRSSTYERVHFNGSKTITHVLWTEEAAERCPGCDHRFFR